MTMALRQLLIFYIFTGLFKTFQCESTLEKNVCTSTICHETGLKMLSYMDTSVEPCDNFYQFACGNFTENFEPPENAGAESGEIDKLGEQISRKFKNYLKKEVNKNEPISFRLLKIYYQKCKSEGNQGREEIFKMFQDLGGWPILDGESWNESNFDLVDTIYKIRQMGYKANYFIDLVMVKDPKNESKSILQIGAPTIEVLEKYNLFKWSRDIEKRMFDVLITKFFNISYNPQEVREMTYLEDMLNLVSAYEESALPQIMTLEELKEKIPSFPWSEYFKKILFNKINPKDIGDIKVSNPKQMMLLMNLLTYNKRVFANYIFWYLYIDFLEDIDYKIVVDNETKRKKLNWSYECWKKLSSKLAPALNIFYSFKKNLARPKVKEELENFIKNMKFSFHRLIKEAQWLDEKTRKENLKKLNNIKFGTPIFSNFINLKKLDEYYNNLYMDLKKESLSLPETDGIIFADSFVTRDVTQEMEPYLNSPIDEINAYYNPQSNSIQILAANLEDINFNADTPDYMRYGPFGTTVGHEITHAFHNIDRVFNNPQKSTETSKKYFQEGSECIEAQYNNYVHNGTNLKLNGTITLHENIADVNGIKAAYLAYEESLEKRGIKEEPRLPYLENYDSRQMFWLAFAHSRCFKLDFSKLNSTIAEEDHTISEFRVTGMLQNREEFSRDFNCPAGSYMNPRLKCKMWKK